MPRSYMGAAFTAILLCGVSVGTAQESITILPNDLIFGANIGEPADGSIEWVRGPATEDGGEVVDLVWDQPSIQSIEFDNLHQISHNPEGNLLGVNYGPNDGGGEIYNLATCSGVLEGQLIGNTEGMGGDLELSNLGGLSVSPDNTRIAVNGYDTGTIIVFDYTAGNCEAAGASLSGARSAVVMADFATQGTGWLDNNTVIGFTSEAELVRVDATTMQGEVVASYDDPGKGSVFTDLEYNPLVSPFLYASYGGFSDNETVNRLFIIDPRQDFSLVANVDFSESMNTMREIALDANGNLYATQFRDTVQLIANANDPTNLADNSSVAWYDPFARSSFAGLDVAVGIKWPNTELLGDFDKNGRRGPSDLDLLATAMNDNDKAFDLNRDGTTDIADRTFWIENLANTFFGDSDFNGEFNSSDFVVVFATAKYENGEPATWVDGDWNGDQLFTSSDFVTAFRGAAYENGPRDGGLQTVPEPPCVALIVLGIGGLIRCCRS
ncbi:hypothetical protein ACFL2H_07680 [Planctomycetota bacterium]